jgi:glycyl-tRNA synthetase
MILPPESLNSKKKNRLWKSNMVTWSGLIGRRYRRQDEAGTPFCITVDGQTTEDKTVTVRDRDSMKQVRVSTGQLLNHLREKLEV